MWFVATFSHSVQLLDLIFRIVRFFCIVHTTAHCMWWIRCLKEREWRYDVHNCVLNNMQIESFSLSLSTTSFFFRSKIVIAIFWLRFQCLARDDIYNRRLNLFLMFNECSQTFNVKNRILFASSSIYLFTFSPWSPIRTFKANSGILASHLGKKTLVNCYRQILS